MERTNFVTKLISVILFAALAVYFCVYVFNYFAVPYSTTPAVVYTVGDSHSAQGIIVRRESLFATGESYVTITAGEGQKVAAGYPVATSYRSEGDQMLAEQISELEVEIEQLQKYADTEVRLQSGAHEEATIRDAIMEMNYDVSRDELSGIDEKVIVVRSLIFSGDKEKTNSRIAYLQSQADTLKGQLGAAGMAISIDSSGLFSLKVDGYENITPSDINTMTASDLNALLKRSESPEANALGKLATGIDWYLAMVVPEEEAQKLQDVLDSEKAKKTVEVDLAGISTGTFEMSIERVDMSGGDDSIVVLSCNYALGETLSARVVEAEIIYSSETGIRVPQDAVYMDEDGNAYVYTETVMQAELHYVDILFEYDHYFLIKSSDLDRAKLREGSEIIIDGEDLYDGKVMAK